MSGTIQNPSAPGDPFLVIGQRLSTDSADKGAAVPSSAIGEANGVVPLDADGKVPWNYLPMELQAILTALAVPAKADDTGYILTSDETNAPVSFDLSA